MKQKITIKKNLYFDSVSLMQLSDQIKSLPHISEAVVIMGTESNKNLLREISLYQEELENATPNDLIIAIRSENQEALNNALQHLEKNLLQKDLSEKSGKEIQLISQHYAYRRYPDINLVLISVPGEFAALEAKKALLANKHIMIFSDNVTIEDEIELKELAVSRGLLLMGPDCGTAMINHIPLGFANAVQEGPIGVIAAAGTGAQEVTSLIARLGSGITQLIGTGGRDLSEQIGGKMMLQALNALNEDESTKVIVLISKPPAKSVADKIIQTSAQMNKPIVICFLGATNNIDNQKNIFFVQYLEEAALKAVELARGANIFFNVPDVEKLAEEEVKKFSSKQKYIRGLYTGGTLCYETMIVLSNEFSPIYSNIPLDKKYKLQNSRISQADTLVDLGDDEFTKGKAHPMIDSQYRILRLLNEAEDDEVAIILLDFVLGFGAHNDPAGAMLDAIKTAKEKFSKRNQYLSIICSVCGTENDPQVLSQQQKILENAGVICMPDNLQAANLAAAIKRRLI